MAYQQEVTMATAEAPSAQPHPTVRVVGAPSFQNLQLRSELGAFDVLGHLIVWLLLTLVTFGLALFVFPYYMQRFIISKTFAYDNEGKKVGRLICTIDLASMIGNIILWAIISILTLGVGYLVFMYKITAQCMTHTKVVAVNAL
ncbi:DUF6693 family protein [Allopusillimonas ginsengisoli]|uniref:DUF6693 family protein n=1 Tax=Allopusillimonas ginsengisoli TaxID=453575 RepID=UPI0039C2AD25